MAKSEFKFDWHSRQAKHMIVFAVLGLVALYVILPQLLGFSSFRKSSLPLHWQGTYLAAGIFGLTFVVAAASFMILAFNRISFFRTLLIQFASVPLNMLLPAGIGNMGVNFMYLRHQKHTPMRAGMVVSANNLIGVIGNLAVLIALFFIFGFSDTQLSLYWHYTYLIILAVVVLVVLVVISFKLLGSHIEHVRDFKRQMFNALHNYSQRPLSFVGALLCAVMQALLYVLAFWYCLQAYGIQLSFPTAFLVFSLSVVVRTSVPTPGGLGGVEASLVAGILASHASNLSLALAAVLAFRLITFWLPLLTGAVALLIVERAKLLSPTG